VCIFMHVIFLCSFDSVFFTVFFVFLFRDSVLFASLGSGFGAGGIIGILGSQIVFLVY